MHDPNTVAFDIPYPWFRTYTLGNRRYRYWPPFITIWHVDPGRGGSDDSCGWFTPPFTKEQREIVNTLAADEAREPWFMQVKAKRNDDPVLCECFVRGAFHLVSMCLLNRGHWWLAATPRECDRWAVEMVHNSVDNFRSTLCFLSGYHSNWYNPCVPNTEEQDRFSREEQARRFFNAILGRILRERRPWWKRPRWHVWHWRIEVHPLQQFKRWVFSRCHLCGKRFGWGESPVSDSWYGTGPRWFRGEQHVRHSACDHATPSGAQEVQP